MTDSNEYYEKLWSANIWAFPPQEEAETINPLDVMDVEPGVKVTSSVDKFVLSSRLSRLLREK